MLEKNFALCATEKINITTHVVRKKISERNKKPYPPPPLQVKWSVPYGFLFRSEFFFRTTQELEYLFFSRFKHYVI